MRNSLKKSDIIEGLELIELKPSKHTTKLHHIVILGVHTGYNHYKNRSYTYYTAKTKENTYYLAANSTDNRPLYLDGVVGSHSLAELKANYNVATS
jgi:hypothetical protein